MLIERSNPVGATLVVARSRGGEGVANATVVQRGRRTGNGGVPSP